MASTPGFAPGPHWWEASALTTAPPLLTMLEKVQPRASKCALESFGRDLSNKERLMLKKNGQRFNKDYSPRSLTVIRQ